ncbi:DUF6252 family protein [Flavobacterium solisilvae]|uniref:Lipoprotein n=1 Tax=Flavobacterium solisilvae TaxID=1852019 RepID=A0ABX1QTI3_9FLAO|nr:DUF6252 family protein [Flavobacterium solisilvae]NMH25580.1 hypothetical protein [Flavobacterium solisilvae]
MKTMKQFGLMLTFVMATLLSSCSGDDNGGGGGSAANGTIKAKVGGSNFKSMEIASFASKNAIGGGAYMIAIQGSDEEGNAIQLILNGVDGQPGTFEIGTDTTISAVGTYTETEINLSNPAASTFTTWAAPYEDSGVVGSITISEITDTTIKGTFNFTGKNQEGTDTKAVTNGAFNLDFTTGN